MTDDSTASREGSPFSRRRLFRFGAAALASAAIFDPIQALASIGGDQFGLGGPVRRLTLVNSATQEHQTVDYWVKGRYITDALRSISHLLRDRHDGSVHIIDPRLVDVMYGIFRMTGACSPVQIVCGYRSPRTNARLRIHHRGVASHSLHMQGKAVDIRMSGCGLSSLHSAALSLRAGGVGYYPSSNFVHVDTGPVRTWGGGRHHFSDDDIGEIPAWRDALLSETPEVGQGGDPGMIQHPAEPEPAFASAEPVSAAPAPASEPAMAAAEPPPPAAEAVVPRRRIFAPSGGDVAMAPKPGHKPMRVAMRDVSPTHADSFVLRRKPHLAGGR